MRLVDSHVHLDDPKFDADREAVLRTLQAGVDVALWITTDEVPAVLDRLEKAVNGGELTMQAVDASVARMVGIKGLSPRCGG